MVTVGPGESFWNDVASGRGESEATLEMAATWVRDVIARKAAQYSTTQKRAMLLALDVRHFGVLADLEFVTGYLRQSGVPDDAGFGGVWLIGPTGGVRLGRSEW